MARQSMSAGYAYVFRERDLKKCVLLITTPTSKSFPHIVPSLPGTALRLENIKSEPRFTSKHHRVGLTNE